MASSEKFYCRGVSHEKQRFGRFSSLPPKPPPLKNRKFYFYCRLAVSEFCSVIRLGGLSGRGRCGNYATRKLVYQSAATLIAALHCISSCHNQSSIESLWNDCSWLQVGRQCNHSICTLRLSTTTHSVAPNDPPPHALQTAL